jgi:hypothetical protein
MTPVDQEAARLEDLLRADPANTSAALDLAQLSLLPLRDDEEADRLVLDVLAREPGHPRAVLLHSYVCLHHWLLDENIAEAAAMLAEVIDRGEELGAAPMLLDQARRRLDPKVPPDLALLRLSVSAEPAWVVNHQRLAWALHATGDDAGARREYERAAAGVFDASVELDPVAESFHDCFTGRTGTVDWLIKDRERVLGR